jgi:hypothetical protein
MRSFFFLPFPSTTGIALAVDLAVNYIEPGLTRKVLEVLKRAISIGCGEDPDC